MLEKKVPLFTTEDFEDAVSSLQNKKAPGHDGIPAELLKAVANVNSYLLLNVYNCCEREAAFHKPWKTQR